MMSVFTENNLKAMGLKEQPDGSWKKDLNANMVSDALDSLSVKRRVKAVKDKYFNVKGIDESNPFFIPGNVISSKNSRQIFKNRKTGNPMVAKSDAALRYAAGGIYQWEKLKPLFRIHLQGKEKPYLIELHFVMDHNFRWDYHNMAQLPLDLMVKHGWLDDDNKDEVKVSFKDYSIDPEKPGLYIKLL